MTKKNALTLSLVAAAGLAIYAQAPSSPKYTAGTLPTNELLSERGPTFHYAEKELSSPVTLITYGDQRFTDPSNKTATDPRVRKWLVDKIASEHPAGVILNGDVPLAGDVANDYAVFQTETKSWREERLHIFPALGNHEFHGEPRQALENWWNAFPELRNRRWYSVQLGSRVYVIQLDSDTSLLPGSDQARWLEKQIEDLPPAVEFVVFGMHHPPVADIQQHLEVDHNPRPNEIALRDYLSKVAASSEARIVVSSGHIHNYERHVHEQVVYLISGGGGAKPYFVERTTDDLYKSVLFPNYHYVKLTVAKDRLHGDMYRVRDPEAETLGLELKDSFDVMVKPALREASAGPASKAQ